MSEAKWTIEKHGDGYALYIGRTGMAHGLNLFNITEVDRNFNKVKPMIEAAPEMYEKLYAIVLDLIDAGGCGNLKTAREIEKILAKARGES